MKITKNTVVYLQFKVYDVAGKILDTSKEPRAYLHGDYDDIFPKIEEALAGKSVGDCIDVTMEPKDAFGEHTNNLIRYESLKDLAHELSMEVKLGVMVEDIDLKLIFTVISIDGNSVKLDGNHPLAGKTLRFTGEVVDVREATADEIAKGTTD